jgi:tetratricopeptide (TPR) repeat protein
MVTLSEALQLAAKHQRANQTPQAAALYQKILVAQPDQPEALYGLGVIAQQSGQLQTAEQYLNQALQVQPELVGAWFSLGNLRQAQNQLPAAEVCYRQVLALSPKSAVAHHNLGYCLQQQGCFSEAIAAYQQALELRPDFREAAVSLGNAYYDQGSLTSEQQPAYAQLNLELGLARYQAQDFQNAATCFSQAITLQPECWEAHLQLGMALQRQGQLETAIASYQSALLLKPDCGEAYLQLGQVYQRQHQVYQRQHQVHSAVTVYRQGLRRVNPVYARAIDKAAAADSALDNDQTVPATPALAQEEVIVGGHRFPRVPPVAECGGSRPFWSVIVTVYNRTDYLLECLASVLAQWPGPADMEIIVMDDASPSQEIFELVNGLGKGIIRYYRNPQNLGLPGNWNAGIMLSRGEWVHLLHDDDYILPGFYERLRCSLETCSETVGAAFTGYENINESGKVVFTQQLYGEHKGIAQDFLLKIGIANPLNMPAVVIRRQTHEKLGTYHPELTYTSDWELYKRIAAFYDWWHEPIMGAHYRQHEQSKTNEMMLSGTQVTSIRRAIDISESYLPAESCAELTKRSRSYYFQRCLETLAIPLKTQNLAAAWQMLEELMRLDQSSEALAQLFAWLTRSEARALRDQMVSRFLLTNA